MKFTVIIPFFNQNSQYRLRNLLKVINTYQNLAPDFDIYVVEQNGNNDVKDLIINLKNVKYLKVNTNSNVFHKTFLLNKAINQIDSEYIIMSDADCILSYIGIDSIRNDYSKGSILFPFSKVNYYNEMNTRRLCKREDSLNATDDRNLPIKRFTGLVNCFSKETFNKVGGFDEEFIGWGAEDDAFVIKCERLVGEIYRTTTPSEVIHMFHPKIDTSEYKKSELFINNKKRVAVIKRMCLDDLINYSHKDITLNTLIDKYEKLSRMDLELNWKVANLVIKLDTTIYDMDNISDMSISKILQCIYDVDGIEFLNSIINSIDEKAIGLSDNQKNEINMFR